MKIKLSYTMFGFAMFAVAYGIAKVFWVLVDYLTVNMGLLAKALLIVLFSMVGLCVLAVVLLAFNFVGCRFIEKYKKKGGNGKC